MVDDNRCYNEDCLDTMSRMDDCCLDMVLTSPPYDNLRDYNGFSFDFGKTAMELYRVLKPGHVVVWVVGDATVDGSETCTSFRQALGFRDVGFNLHDTMIYQKSNPIPTAGNRYQQSFEYMFVLSKGSPVVFNPIMEPTVYSGIANMKNRGREGGLEYRKIERTESKKVSNVFRYSVGGGISTTDAVAFEHPAIFPERLALDQIETWSNVGDLVYDPFMGSGTTAKMCIASQRRWIGSEISADYCSIIERRLSSGVELNLF